MSKKQILEYLLETNTTISVGQMAFSLLMAVLLAAVMYVVYRKTYRGTLYSKNFNLTLVLIAIITTVVMVIIGSNLALSLGMVGSLSIIRFRTAIKEPRDIAFLFWAIAIGLSCGSEFYIAGILGSVVVAVVLVLANLDLYDSVSYLLVLRGQTDALDPVPVEAALKQNSRRFKLRMRSESDGTLEMTYELCLKSSGVEPLLGAVRRCAGVESLNLVSYSGELVG